MPAYVVVHTQVLDAGPMAEYREKVPALLAKHGGRYLARGTPVAKLEGSDPLADAVVIMEFPSLDHANAWYADPGYARLIALRQSGARSEMTLLNGVWYRSPRRSRRQPVDEKRAADGRPFAPVSGALNP